MHLSFKAFYQKEAYIINTEIPFEKDCDFEAQMHKYYFISGFDLLEVDDDFEPTKGKEPVAIVKAVFFKYDNICANKKSIIDVADGITTFIADDSINAMEALISNDLLPEGKSNNIESICYLSRLYIHPEHRKRGVATYIFENMQELFKYIIGEKTNIVVIYPEPQKPNNDKWESINDYQMLKQMISMLERHDFAPIEDTGFYYKMF